MGTDAQCRAIVMPHYRDRCLTPIAWFVKVVQDRRDIRDGSRTYSASLSIGLLLRFAEGQGLTGLRSRSCLTGILKSQLKQSPPPGRSTAIPELVGRYYLWRSRNEAGCSRVMSNDEEEREQGCSRILRDVFVKLYLAMCLLCIVVVFISGYLSRRVFRSGMPFPLF